QPGAKPGPLIKVLHIPVGPEEGLLDHILGVLFVACHPKCKTEQGAAVALHNQTETVRIATLAPSDRRLIAALHPGYPSDGQSRVAVRSHFENLKSRQQDCRPWRLFIPPGLPSLSPLTYLTIRLLPTLPAK